MTTNKPADTPANNSATTPVNTPATPAGDTAAAPISPETQAALASTPHAPNSPGATHIRSFVHRRGHITLSLIHI